MKDLAGSLKPSASQKYKKSNENRLNGKYDSYRERYLRLKLAQLMELVDAI